MQTAKALFHMSVLNCYKSRSEIHVHVCLSVGEVCACHHVLVCGGGGGMLLISLCLEHVGHCFSIDHTNFASDLQALKPEQVVAVHIDNGFMRKNESASVMESLKRLDLRLTS